MSADSIEKALRRAFDLGQQYWQQADSDSYKQNAKSHITRDMFDELVADTIRALSSLAELERDAAIGRLVRSKLVSDNDVPVERCLIYAKEIVPLAASPARDS